MKTDTITIGGGCFWCTEAIFKRLKGVTHVTSGYAGGTMNNPGYEDVVTGRTGHTESIQIEFDPQVINLAQLLEVFFHLHNPTTLNQQGADIGTEYRSVIFYHSADQKKVADAVVKKIEEEHVYKDPVVTSIEPFKNFFKAEEYHQDFYAKNSGNPYCQIVIDPKIHKLIDQYKPLLKE